MLDFFIGKIAVARRRYGQRKSVGMHLIFLAVTTALCLAFGELSADTTRRSASDAASQEAAAPDEGSKIERQNIQRLLTLLADRYPTKYGSVDPGTIDGSFGAETKTAIRNFRQISGSKSGGSSGEQLVADILAALAQMSATQSADAPKSQPPAPAVTPAPAAAPVAPPVAPQAEPRAGTADIKTAEVKSTPNGNADTAAVDPPKIATPNPNQIQAASKGQRLYFVQAASLKSLDSAKREWRRIFEDNRAALTGEQVYYERANLGDRGVFFRILIGPMNERDAARTLCAFLKQNDQTCVVTAKDPTGLLKGESFTDAATPAAAGEGTRAPQPSMAGSGQAPAPAGEQEKTRLPVPAPDHNAASASIGEAVADGKTEPAPPRLEDPASPPARGETPGAADSRKAASGAPTGDPAAPAVEASAPAAAKTDTPKTAGSGSATSSGADQGADRAADADQRDAETATPVEGAPAAAGHGPPPADPASDTAPPSRAEPQSGDVDANGTRDAETASAGIPPASRPAATLDAARALVLSLAQELDWVLGAAAAVMIIGAGVLIYGWRRRSRRLPLSQIFQSANLVFLRGDSENAGALGTIENDFESESLQQSRLARDKFLREALGDASDANAARSDDAAMRINSSLKALLVKEPAQYKSIFLNWIFLAKVGAALNNKEISIEQLSSRIKGEFELLQTYFKIHLLELDDRHRIRQELPGLFYCLQVSQMQKRQNSAEHSAA